jgi:hypothetical protein
VQPPKQKQPMKKPKQKEKSIVRAKSINRATNSSRKYVEIKEKSESEYATNRFEDMAKDTAETGAEIAYRGARNGYRKSRQNSKVKDRKELDSDGLYKQTSKSYMYPRQSSTENNRELAKIKANIHSVRKRTKSKSLKNAIFTGSKNSVKTASKSIKQSTKSVKSSTKTVKVGNTTTKTAYKAAKASAIASKRAMIVAKQTAIATKQAAVFSFNAVKAAIAAMIESIKGVIALIAAGGWVVVLILVIVGAFGVVLASPFGLFFNEGDEDHPSISQVVTELNAEYTAEINKIIAQVGEVDVVNFDGESDSSIFAPPNWIDILAIFSVKYTITETDEEYMDMLVLGDMKVEALREVFWDLNEISFEVTEVEPEPTPTPSPELEDPEEQKPVMVLTISTEHTNHIQASGMYGFNLKQNEMMTELLSGEYHSLFMEIIGMDSFSGLTPEQLSNLINDLPAGTKGAEVVRQALSRLGHPYSQSLRGQGIYVDCSYLTRWAYQQAGVSHFVAPTAASQAEYCVNNGLTISKADLLAGDLVFWSHKVNGRFLNITHTGVYAGDGMVIDASFSRGIVVYRPLFDADKQVVYGRPHVK